MNAPQRRPLSLPDLVLAPLEGIYRSLISLDSWRHQRRVARGDWPLYLDRPVLSVGNIVSGGTGKTPVVEALARHWLRHGGRPGILSRGYRSRDGHNDEFAMLKERLPGVPHRQHADRYAAGRQLLGEHPEVDLVILDDGFQHRRLHRDLDVVLLDALDPLGGGHCLPRGWLREPPRRLTMADHIILTRVERCQGTQLQETRTFLDQYFGGIPRLESRIRAEGLATLSGKPAGDVSKMKVACFCGIGQPDSFFELLASLGAEILGTRTFADHHRYRRGQLRDLRRWGRDLGADALLCTEKDAVKFDPSEAAAGENPPLLKLRITVEVDCREIMSQFTASVGSERGDPEADPC